MDSAGSGVVSLPPSGRLCWPGTKQTTLAPKSNKPGGAGSRDCCCEGGLDWPRLMGRRRREMAGAGPFSCQPPIYELRASLPALTGPWGLLAAPASLGDIVHTRRGGKCCCIVVGGCASCVSLCEPAPAFVCLCGCMLLCFSL